MNARTTAAWPRRSPRHSIIFHRLGLALVHGAVHRVHRILAEDLGLLRRDRIHHASSASRGLAGHGQRRPGAVLGRDQAVRGVEGHGTVVGEGHAGHDRFRVGRGQGRLRRRVILRTRRPGPSSAWRPSSPRRPCPSPRGGPCQSPRLLLGLTRFSAAARRRSTDLPGRTRSPRLRPPRRASWLPRIHPRGPPGTPGSPFVFVASWASSPSRLVFGLVGERADGAEGDDQHALAAHGAGQLLALAAGSAERCGQDALRRDATERVLADIR